MLNKAIISSSPSKASLAKTSLSARPRPRLFTFAVPPALRHSRLPSSSLHAISNHQKSYHSANATASIKPLAINFSTKSLDIETLRMLEKMRKEAREAHPDNQWKIISPLPGIYGVISEDAKVFRWVDPTKQRQQPCNDEPIVTVAKNLGPGWIIESIPPPVVSGKAPPRIEDIGRYRRIFRDTETSKGNITQFYRRKNLDATVVIVEPVQNWDWDRNAVYSYLKDDLVPVTKCTVKVYDNGETNNFIALCKPEAATAKPLLLLFEENFGKSLEKTISPNMKLSLQLADTLGWKCEKIVLKSRNSPGKVEKTLKRVQRWCAAADGKTAAAKVIGN